MSGFWIKQVFEPDLESAESDATGLAPDATG